jgi:hypothetical protein
LKYMNFSVDTKRFLERNYPPVLKDGLLWAYLKRRGDEAIVCISGDPCLTASMNYKILEDAGVVKTFDGLDGFFKWKMSPDGKVSSLDIIPYNDNLSLSDNDIQVLQEIKQLEEIE